MFGLGFLEVAFIALIAFLVFGPKQFPIVAKNFLQAFNELRSSFMKVQNELRDLETEIKDSDTMKEIHSITKETEALKEEPPKKNE